jgi:hypothetical protein
MEPGVSVTRGEGGWTVEEFHAELARFEEELKAPGIAPNTVHRYADRSGSGVQQLLVSKWQSSAPPSRPTIDSSQSRSAASSLSPCGPFASPACRSWAPGVQTPQRPRAS